MKRIYIVFAMMMVIGSGSVKADERATGFVGADCYGAVKCNGDNNERRCQTKLAGTAAVRSLCTRHFSSEEGYVLCRTFDRKNNIVNSEKLDCGG